MRSLKLFGLCLFAMILGASLTRPAFAEEAGAAPKSLYERLGGEAAIKAVVDEFVALAASDPKVNFTRKGTDREWAATPENIDKLKLHLVQFISVATGGTSTYEGKDMKSAHENMKITGAEFAAIAADLKAALDKFNVPAAEEKELLDIVGTTRSVIVEVEE